MGSLYRVVDGTSSSLLYDGEEKIAMQDGVGIYDGKEKILERQNGAIQLTTHRLLYIDHGYPQKNSFSLALSHIRQTEYYAGFLTSSAKVTVYLNTSTKASDPLLASASVPASASPTPHRVPTPEYSLQKAWICSVCSYNNPPKASEGRPKCFLCGVVQDERAYAASTSKPAVTIPSTMATSTAVLEALASTSRPESPASSSFATPSDSSSTVSCPACTYLNHPSMSSCEICGTSLKGGSSFSSLLQIRQEVPLPSRDMLRISFRKGGDKAFYAALKKALLQRAWEESSIGSGTITPAGPPRLGIQRVLDSVESSARQIDTSMSASLQDLEALKIKAKDMVALASSLNAKLTAQEAEIARRKALFPNEPIPVKDMEPEEATFIRSSMAHLGLQSAAVTLDMVKDEEKYHEELAKELAEVLHGTRSGTGVKERGLMGSEEAIIGLDEVWRGWNRARGVALVPPLTLLLCIPYLPQFTSPPVQLRIFQSGLRVLHTPHYSDDAFKERLLKSIEEHGGYQSTIQIATLERVSIGLAEEMIGSVEIAGDVLRDDGAPDGVTRWYPNIFDGYVWDGQSLDD